MDSNVKKTLQNRRFRVIRHPDSKMHKIHDPMEEVRKSTPLSGNFSHGADPVPPGFFMKPAPVEKSMPWYSGLWSGISSTPGVVWSAVSGGAVAGYTAVTGGLMAAYSAIISFFTQLFKSIGGFSVSLWDTVSSFFVMLWRGIFGLTDPEDTFTSPLVA